MGLQKKKRPFSERIDRLSKYRLGAWRKVSVPPPFVLHQEQRIESSALLASDEMVDCGQMEGRGSMV
jgi:hypothetical protein